MDRIVEISAKEEEKMASKIVVVATTLHDPEGRLEGLIEEIGPKIAAYFEKKVMRLI